MVDTLQQYPHWLVVVCAVVVAAFVLWLLVQLLKAALYLMFFGLVVAAGAFVVWLLLHWGSRPL